MKTAYHLSCGKQPHFPTTETKFQVKRRMKGGWIQAEDLHVLIIFFESQVKSQSPSRAQWHIGRRLSPFLSPRPRVCGCSEGYSGGLVHW